MNITVSDLLFPGFTKFAIRELDPKYGIEFFYEFGKDYYWDEELAAWGKRELSIHGPCVAIDLADPAQTDFVQIYAKTFAYAKKCNAKFVVVHSNETIVGNPEEAKARVLECFELLFKLAENYGVQIVIENVGLLPKHNYLFTLPDFLDIFKKFPQAKALLDTGHAHVNGWDLAEVVRALGPTLIAFHLHDNDGKGDQHLPIGQGNTDWDAFFAAVKEYVPNPTFVLEYCCGFSNTQALEEHIDELKTKYYI